jgi:two-component system KDP operon response regulator KdpE
MIILDLGLPDIDGIDLLVNLREWFFKPIIILTVRNSEDDIIHALDKGANDYLTKPFRSGELLARIRSAIRLKNEKTNIPLLEFGSLKIDFVNHVVRKNDEIIKLTSTEFSLLSILSKNHGRVMTHQFLLKEIWGYNYLDQTQYLRVFVAQLRKKIEDNPSKPVLMITESGIGYRFGN